MSKKQNIVFWCVAIVILTLYNLTPPIDSFDTPYYLLAGENFWHGRIDCLRTPVYPLLLKCSSELFGYKGMAVVLTILQSLLYIISLVSLKRISEKAIKNSYLRFALLLFYVICIAPGWCNELLTESLSISGMIIMVDCILSYIEQSKINCIIFIHLMLLFLVFLRPTFIIFFAILPMVWIYQLFHFKQYIHNSIALILTIACIICFTGYCKSFQREYGLFGSTSTLVFNKIYDAKRGGYWDVKAIQTIESREWIEQFDGTSYSNYSDVYSLINNHPEALPHINKGCDDMISAHKFDFYRYRAQLLASSFDKRFLAAVNTETTLSSVLFLTTLFLSFPLSLFYLFTIIVTIFLFIHTLKQKKINPTLSLLTIIILAHTLGVILTASDAFERVLLPVYPLFLVLIGISLEKAELIIKQ